MKFVAHFPYLVHSIVLLAPAGILRQMPQDYDSLPVRFPFAFPSSYLRRFVGKILGADLEPRKVKEYPPHAEPLRTIDVPAAVQWQFDRNHGFVASFLKSARDGPIMHQQRDWQKVCAVIKRQRGDVQGRSSKLCGSKILVIFGKSDGTVVGNEVSGDLERMLGAEHVVFRTVPGTHGFPVSSSEQTLDHIFKFWDL